jgi:hypothetical protein
VAGEHSVGLQLLGEVKLDRSLEPAPKELLSPPILCVFMLLRLELVRRRQYGDVDVPFVGD